MDGMPPVVSELASLANGPPVVTLYLDTAWRDEQQRSRVRLFFRDRARDARGSFGAESDAGRAIARTLDELALWVDDLVNQAIHPDARGMAVFASEPRGLFVECRLPDSVPAGMFIERRPQLFPLLTALSAAPRLLIVSVDSRGADVLECTLGEVAAAASIDQVVPRRHHKGGWSQRRFEQHTRRVVKGVWRECAQLVGQHLGAQHASSVVLFGQIPNIRGFDHELPPAVRECVIGRRPAPEDERLLVSEATEIYEEQRVTSDFAVVHHILRQGLSERTGTVGLQGTLLAVNERRVRVLALSSRFAASGFRCRNCLGLSTTGARGCVWCGAPTDVVSLSEELGRRCVLEGADLTVVPGGGPLDAYDGIGSILRHLSGPEKHGPQELPQGVQLA
jgi:hypothetical protein